MLRKVLLRSQRPLQLIIALLGAFAGVFILLFSVQVYVDLKSALDKRDDLLGADYLVIQKSVTTLNTLGSGGIGFSEKEISDIHDESFVEEVGIFEASRFKVTGAITGLPGAKELYTEAYFEAVPDRFLDVKSNEWKWIEHSKDVPVILPGAYLDAFNFGFGPSQGLPPLTEKAFKLLKLRIRIQGTSEVYFNGRIVGFSDRINTILVPLNFLRYANANFQSRPETEPARLILAVSDIAHPGIARMMEDKGYDTNQENLKGSRIKTVLIVSLSLFLLIGGVIVILSILSFIQYSQILISKVNYELRVLLLMGYRHNFLAGRYILYTVLLVMLVFALGFLALVPAKAELLKYLKSYEMDIAPGLSWQVWITAIGLFLLYLLFNGWSIALNIRRLAKSLQG